MARIPLQVGQRSLETGSVVKYPTADPVGKALETAGGQLTDVATRWTQMLQQEEDLKATLAYDNFRRTAEAKIQAAKDAMPADGAGFLDTVNKTVEEERKGFLAQIPPRLRERYTLATQNELVGIQSRAAHLQLEANRGFARTEIAKLHNRLSNDILANPDPASADKVYAFGLKAIDESTLPELEKVQHRKVWHDNARTAEAQARWRDKPEEMAQAFGVPYERVLDRSEWERALIQRESSGNPRAVNKDGYAGLFQFGAPRMAAIGMYVPGASENVSDAVARGGWSGLRWSGMFRISGFPEVKSLNDFLSSPGAQKAAFQAHIAQMDREIVSRGLEQYIGQTVAGVPITREGIYSMMHLGGAAGAQAALEGRGNARDDNGTSVLDYARLAARNVPGGNPDPRYVDLPLEYRQRAVAQMDVLQRREDAERRKQESVAYRQQVNSLETQILNGAATYEDVQKARSDGWLSDAGDIARLVGAIERRDEQVNVSRQAMAAFETPGFTWNPYSAEHKKMAEAVYANLGGDLDALRSVVSKTGMLPANAATSLRGALTSTNVQRMELGLRSAGDLIGANPHIFAGVEGGNDLAQSGLTFREYVYGRGMAPADAARKIMEERTPEYQERVKARVKSEDVNKIVRERLSIEDLEKAFDPSWGWMSNPKIGFDPKSRVRAMGDYEDAFRDHFMRNGDVELSKTLAQKEMERTWGVTQVNGKRIVMKYPPEMSAAYGSRKTAADIEDLAGVFAAHAQRAIKETTGQDVPRENLMILEEPKTGERFMRGQPPTYLLAYTDQNGVVQVIPRPFAADPEQMRREQTERREADFYAVRRQRIQLTPDRLLTPDEVAQKRQMAAERWTPDPQAMAMAADAREAAAARLAQQARPQRGEPVEIGTVLSGAASSLYDLLKQAGERNAAERKARMERLYGR